MTGEVATHCSIRILSKTITSSLLSLSHACAHRNQTISRALSCTFHETGLPLKRKYVCLSLPFSQNVCSQWTWSCMRNQHVHLGTIWGSLFKSTGLVSPTSAWLLKNQVLGLVFNHSSAPMWTNFPESPSYDFPESKNNVPTTCHLSNIRDVPSKQKDSIRFCFL